MLAIEEGSDGNDQQANKGGPAFGMGATRSQAAGSALETLAKYKAKKEEKYRADLANLLKRQEEEKQRQLEKERSEQDEQRVRRWSLGGVAKKGAEKLNQTLKSNAPSKSNGRLRAKSSPAPPPPPSPVKVSSPTSIAAPSMLAPSADANDETDGPSLFQWFPKILRGIGAAARSVRGHNNELEEEQDDQHQNQPAGGIKVDSTTTTKAAAPLSNPPGKKGTPKYSNNPTSTSSSSSKSTGVSNGMKTTLSPSSQSIKASPLRKSKQVNSIDSPTAPATSNKSSLSPQSIEEHRKKVEEIRHRRLSENSRLLGTAI